MATENATNPDIRVESEDRSISLTPHGQVAVTYTSPPRGTFFYNSVDDCRADRDMFTKFLRKASRRGL